MLDWLTEAYPWIKALHVISVIAWMAGMLYLPRLFVYHAEAEVGSAQSETFKVMERRLLRAIINPAMIAAFVLGGLLLATPGVIDWQSGWIWVKLAAVLVLSGFHGYLARWRRYFANDDNRHGTKFYRAMNEVPTVLMVLIVIMVIVRPF
jgi:putative membrane protein